MRHDHDKLQDKQGMYNEHTEEDEKVDVSIAVFGKGTVVTLKSCNTSTSSVPSNVLCPLMLTASFSPKDTSRRITLMG